MQNWIPAINQEYVLHLDKQLPMFGKVIERNEINILFKTENAFWTIPILSIRDYKIIKISS